MFLSCQYYVKQTSCRCFSTRTKRSQPGP